MASYWTLNQALSHPQVNNPRTDRLRHTPCPRDYYRLLGVHENATFNEIRRAYRRLAHASHPDKHPNDPTAPARFREATMAYEVLRTPITRTTDDRLTTLRHSTGFWDFDDRLFDVVFADLFNNLK